MTKQLQTPAFTYATPSRAVRSVEKMAVSHGGMQVRFVISKDARGRYFPVFVGRVKQVPGEGTEARETVKKRATRKTAAKKVAKKSVKKTTRKTLH